MKFNLREKLFQIWYWYVNKVDKNAEILFMNYGYSDKDQEILMDEESKPDRYAIQLYLHLASATALESKDIVEIGCGRGGGLSYITSHFSPASAIGVDLDKQAVLFCKRHYDLDALSFMQGDAQNLSLKNNSCDVVLNVESSHRYPDMKAFMAEVSRILRPGGYFLITDFRFDYEMEDLKKDLDLSGMTMLKERFMNQEVVTALELDDERRRRLVQRLSPRILHKIALNFGGTIGSETYERFVSGEYIYFSYVLKKSSITEVT